MNGEISPGPNKISSQRDVLCHDGFELEGNSHIYCLDGGVWSEPGRCLKRPTTTLTPQCGLVPKVSNGLVSPGNNTIASIRRLSCNTGFNLVGNSFIVCLSSRHWSPPGACNPTIQCSIAGPQVLNGQVSSGSSVLNANRNISCDVGYELNGNTQIFCLSSGQWSSAGVCRPRPTSTTTTTPFTGDVNIYPELRLVGSQNGNPNEGFVIIKTHNGSWGSVAFDSFWSDKTAKVACRNLGFE